MNLPRLPVAEALPELRRALAAGPAAVILDKEVTTIAAFLEVPVMSLPSIWFMLA